MRFLISICISLLLCGCDEHFDSTAIARTGGDAQRGRDKINFYGCASCHTIPGIHGADARVGPSLERVAGRSYIGVGLENNPQNLIEWIKHSRDLDPKAAMPNLHISDADARDIACYLYTLR